jgi:hypothetical protein
MLWTSGAEKGELGDNVLGKTRVRSPRCSAACTRELERSKMARGFTHRRNNVRGLSLCLPFPSCFLSESQLLPPLYERGNIDWAALLARCIGRVEGALEEPDIGGARQQ